MRVDRVAMGRARVRHERLTDADLAALIEQTASEIPLSLAQRYMLAELGGLVMRHSEQIVAALRMARPVGGVLP